MKELNELVELANRANIAGQGTPEMADFRVTARPDNILAIAEAFRALEQENSLLKQGCENNPLVHEMIDWKERAEAAEAKLAEEKRINSKLREDRAGLARECNAFEAKLAGMEKQEPIGRVDRGAVTDSNEYPDARVLCLHDHVGWEAFQDGYGLFARPVPAVSLMELVPEPFKVFRQGGGVMVAVRDGRTKNHLYGIGYNACIAEVINRIINSGDLTKPEHESDEATLCKILRNIEEQSQ
ncbi:hypothetical protein QM543_07215 [Pantoea eucrina]|uniref:hypothetical protein n=1 Tax=Pantoea eucrina TaxID=472693 RepID=UPI0024B6AE9E|nr:hypothetical protein [Pantoea eucrina]MDJ0023070.1 hypothetical protein [Pantoea eucrina]